MQFLANLPPLATQMKRAERERMTALHVAAYRCRLAPMWHKPEPQLGGVYLLKMSPYSPAMPSRANGWTLCAAKCMACSRR